MSAGPSQTNALPDDGHQQRGRLEELPGRVLLDTCILNRLYDEGGYLFDGDDPVSGGGNADADLQALRTIFAVNQRAAFELLVSPLSVAEVSNIQDFPDRERRVRWLLDVLDHWLVMLDERLERVADGGTVRHRFKLTPELQAFEASLMDIPDFRRDPLDRLLLVQYRMGNCDAFLTTDRLTIWRHREALNALGVRVLTPDEYWAVLRPWAALWL
jgi:hypothetical protein